jgi:anti-sigma-K factor RskA
MKGTNKNIEEIKLLLPDYISGHIEPEDKKSVEEAINSSPELQGLLIEMSSTLGFVSNVKYKEPDPAYWASLLPRIHERIEQAEAKNFSWDKILSYWKVLVPVTAVIILAVLYFTVIKNNDNSTLTEKRTEKVNPDTNIKTETPEKKEIVKETNNTEKVSSIVKKQTGHVHHKKVKDNIEPVKDEILKDEQIKQDDFEDIVQTDLEEESVFTGSTAGVEEEIENSLNDLNENEKDKLVQELLKSNL